jgi:hypothetical protein
MITLYTCCNGKIDEASFYSTSRGRVGRWEQQTLSSSRHESCVRELLTQQARGVIKDHKVRQRLRGSDQVGVRESQDTPLRRAVQTGTDAVEQEYLHHLSKLF